MQITWEKIYEHDNSFCGIVHESHILHDSVKFRTLTIDDRTLLEVCFKECWMYVGRFECIGDAVSAAERCLHIMTVSFELGKNEQKNKTAKSLRKML